MVAHLNQTLYELVAVKQHQLVEEVKWDAAVAAADVLKCVEQDVMGILVVTDLLLLLSNVYSNLDRLSSVAEGTVQTESVLGLLGDVISLAHEVVHELVGERVELSLGDHIDHIRDA